MGAGEIGNITGTFLMAILLPVLILIVCNFISAPKRNPAVVYGICGVLAVAVPFLALNAGGSVVDTVIAAALAGAFMLWGYTRAAKKARALKSP
jgi:hypothetical protein